MAKDPLYTREQLSDLEALSAAASPGPWEVDGRGFIETGDGCGVAMLHPHGSIHTTRRYGEDFSSTDGRFLVAARDHMAPLIRRLRSEMDKAALYERDWYEAKSEFGTALANQRANMLKVRHEIAAREADIERLVAAKKALHLAYEKAQAYIAKAAAVPCLSSVRPDCDCVTCEARHLSASL